MQDDELLRAVVQLSMRSPPTVTGEFGDVLVGVLGVPLGDGCDDAADAISAALARGVASVVWLPALLTSSVLARSNELMAECASGSAPASSAAAVAVHPRVTLEVVGTAALSCPVALAAFVASPVSCALRVIVLDAASRATEVDTTMRLYRGIGSCSFVAHSVGRKVVLVIAADKAASDVIARAAPIRAGGSVGSLDSWEGLPLLGWKLVDVRAQDDAPWITKAGDLTVSAGHAAVIGPGAVLVLSAGGDVVVESGASLRARGSAESPILITSPVGSPWGELVVRGVVELEHVWFVNGGGSNASRVFGHSGSPPVIRFGFVSPPSQLSSLIACGIIDCPGKAFGAMGARVLMDAVVIARVDTGGELVQSQFTIRRAHVSEIPSSSQLVRARGWGAIVLCVHIVCRRA